MRRLRISRRAPLAAAATLALAAGAAACSSGSPSAAPGGNAPELSTVTVYTTGTQDAVPLWLAQQDGFFKKQGLTVNITIVPGSAASEAGLLAHTVDFSMENYVGALQEQASQPRLGLRFVADDLQATANTSVLMVAKDSKIKTLAQLKGKTVAFPSPGLDVGSLELDEQLRAVGLSPGSYTDEAIGFPDMATPLQRGEIDAAFSVQPFITIMESTIGARPLVDFNTGATVSFPSSLWATTAWFQQRYPKTVAAFQQGIEQGTRLAASDPALVRQVMPRYIKGLTPKLASVIALQNFNTTLSVTRLRRVADAMREFNAIPANFNVTPMIVSLPAGA